MLYSYVPDVVSINDVESVEMSDASKSVTNPATQDNSWRRAISNKTKTLLLAAVVVIAVSAVLAYWYPSISRRIFNFTFQAGDTSRRVVVIRFLLILPLISLVASWIVIGWSKTNEWLHRRRFWIGAAMVLLAVLLDINGSSLGVWNQYLGRSSGLDVVFGVPRPLRTDEFAINTPLAFSQDYNNYGYFNTILGNRASDMFIIKDEPVWALAEVFRPFHWGYLLLGSSRGLAFYWSARLVALALVSYQFFLTLSSHPQKKGEISEGNRSLSILGAALISGAPLIQWWFAVNNIVELIIAVMLSTVMLQKYLGDHNTFHRLGYAGVITLCAGMFLLSLYPAWQIPLAYLLLALIVWVIAANWGNIRMSKMDWIGVAILLLLFLMLMATVLGNSWPTIQATMETSYPGKRVSTGGGVPFAQLFSSSASAILPFKEFSAPSGVTEFSMQLNSSETAMFFDLFPLGIILMLINLVRKRIDLLSILLAGLILFSAVYMLVGFPTILAKITAMSYVTPHRAYILFGIANVLLLIRSVSLLPAHKLKATLLVPLAAALAIAQAWITYRRYTGYVGILIAGCIAVMLFVLILAVLSSRLKARRFGVWCLTLSIAGLSAVGLSVNPVQYSAKVLTDQPVVSEVKAIQANHPGVWMTSGTISHLTGKLLVGNGVTTINSVSVTPNVALWQKIDPSGKYYEQYNRYASVSCFIVKGNADDAHQLFTADAAHLFVRLNALQVHELGVDYVLSADDLSDKAYGGWEFIKIGDAISGQTPYRLQLKQ